VKHFREEIAAHIEAGGCPYNKQAVKQAVKQEVGA